MSLEVELRGRRTGRYRARRRVATGLAVGFLLIVAIIAVRNYTYRIDVIDAAESSPEARHLAKGADESDDIIGAPNTGV